MCSEEPAFAQGGDPMDGGQQLARVLAAAGRGPLAAPLVGVTQARQSVVAGPAVGDDAGARLDALADERAERTGGRVGQHSHPAPADTLRLADLDRDAGEHLLAALPPAAQALLLPADKGLVHLHRAGQPVPARPHQRTPQPVQHRPRSVVRADLQGPLQMLGGDPVLRGGEQPTGVEPDRQRRARLVEDRARRHRGPPAAAAALDPAISQPPASGMPTPRANEPARPTQPLQVVKTVLVGAEPRQKLTGRPRVVRTRSRIIHEVRLLRLTAYPRVGYPRVDLPASEWARDGRSYREIGPMRHRHVVVAVRGERLARFRLEVGTAEVGPGAPQDEMLELFGLDKDGRIALQVFFDSVDVDAAVAELDAAHAGFEEEVHRQARRLENAASQAYERLQPCFASRDWDAMAEILADDICTEDRRRVVNSGRRYGRDAVIAEISALAEIGVKNHTSDIIATRGGHLVLSRARSSGRDQRPEAFHTEVLDIVEVDGDGKIVSRVVFDPDDFAAAIGELDARYLAGEAAAHSRTWSVITRGNAALNRRELPPTTPDWVNIDHRRGTSIAPGEMPALLGAAWNLTSDLSNFIETVHRLNNLGAVVTHMAHETSQEGFHAEWRVISVLTLEGDMFNRCEVFDETDLDAAIARFDELNRPARRLENAASQLAERFLAHFAAGDWDTMAEILADNFSGDDRRRVVGAGVRHGRDAEIADVRAIAGLGVTNVTSTVMATRGRRLVLLRASFSSRDQGSEAFLTELLAIAEINSDNRMAAYVAFDLEDFEAAIAELDARYIAGEAATHARTWSVITGGHAALNRHELPPTTPDCVSIDHRRGTAFAPGELIAYFRAGWDLKQDIRTYVETVHRLSDLGAVCTHAAHGISHEGFDAEWRGVDLLTVEGDMFNRCEVFDEVDLDTAIARFEQLSHPAPRLENAASQVFERFLAHFTAGDWDAMAELLADKFSSDDRRRVVGAGIRHGRDAQIADMRAIADLGITNVTPTVMATRGGRLILIRVRFSDRDQAHEAFLTEALGIVEINADERIVALVSFDTNDIDAAFEDLDARYLAGEAAAHSHTWSVIAALYAGYNRQELPATADLVSIDHRPLGRTIEAGDLAASMRAVWDLTPDLTIYMEAVHRLSDLGVVVTHTAYGTSQQGFDAEWRMIFIFAVEGDLINRCEIFDEVDIDAALAGFEELHPQARRLENAASRLVERFFAYAGAREWDTMAEILADGSFVDDRRRVVNAGLWHGRDVVIANMRALVETRVNITLTVIGTRGERLALIRVCFPNDQRLGEFGVELLSIVEIDADNQMAAYIGFDVDDINAAFEELDARYLAGEAAAHAQTWSVIAEAFAALNRHERFATTPDWIHIDHRPLATFEAGNLAAYLSATWELTPDISMYIEAVHRLSDLGAVLTHAAYGTSREGFDAEWRMILLLTADSDLINRGEIFDETDLDAALARFEELHPQSRRLENAASQLVERFLAHFAARDWNAMAQTLTDDVSADDRRRVVGAGLRHGQDAAIADMRAIADLGRT